MKFVNSDKLWILKKNFSNIGYKTPNQKWAQKSEDRFVCGQFFVLPPDMSYLKALAMEFFLQTAQGNCNCMT